MLKSQSIKESTFILIDAIASEYGWSLNEIMNIPSDVLFKLFFIIQKRKSEASYTKTKLLAIATGCGFNGKIDLIDKLFDKEQKLTKEEEQKQLDIDMRNLWVQMGKDPKEYDRQLKANGSVRF